MVEGELAMTALSASPPQIGLPASVATIAQNHSPISNSRLLPNATGFFQTGH